MGVRPTAGPLVRLGEVRCPAFVMGKRIVVSTADGWHWCWWGMGQGVAKPEFSSFQFLPHALPWLQQKGNTLWPRLPHKKVPFYFKWALASTKHLQSWPDGCTLQLFVGERSLMFGVLGLQLSAHNDPCCQMHSWWQHQCHWCTAVMNLISCLCLMSALTTSSWLLSDRRGDDKATIRPDITQTDAMCWYTYFMGCWGDCILPLILRGASNFS